MSGLSGIAKIKQLLGHAAIEHYGCWLNGFDVIEILGHIESLEETIRLSEPSPSDVSETQKNKCVWKKIANAGSMWRSGCGCTEYIANNGSPIAFDWRYCHYCGKEIEEAL